MVKQAINNIKLGLFVILGFLFFMVMLYWVGKDTNTFSSNIELKARFRNVNGLMPGNNVRFSGIQIGTVRTVTILDDSTIEIMMVIDEDVKQFIHKNALVNIGSEGLMGNKIVNIIPGKGESPEVNDGDLLAALKNPDTDEMLKILYETNNTVAQIAVSVKSTVDQVNNSTTLWSLLNDASVSTNIKSSLQNIRSATTELNDFISDLREMAEAVQSGEGPAGAAIYDTVMAAELKHAVLQINQLANTAQEMVNALNTDVQQLSEEIKTSNGTAKAVISDTAMVNRLNRTLVNIEKGTATFHEDMKALQSNFLLRRYFRKNQNSIANDTL